MKCPVNFGDPAELRAFLEALRDHALDGLAAGEDATRAARERVFSRHEAHRRIAEAEKAFLSLIAPAIDALPDDAEVNDG